MSRSIRVLIVEDSAEEAELIVVELRRGGLDFTCRQIENAESLQVALDSNSGDIVITATAGVHFDALSVLNVVRSFDLHLPLIVVSDTPGEDLAVELMRAGANDYLLKQRLGRLTAAVNHALETSDGRRVSEQRNRELLKSLQESEAHERVILESSPDCIISMDHRGMITEFNWAAERTFGYSRAQALGRPMVELLVPPEYRGDYARGMANFLKTGEGRLLNQRSEVSGLRSDGSTFPAELTVTSVKINGLPLFTAFLRDITKRKEAERALSESEERYRTLLDSIPMPLFVYDRETLEYVAVNKAAIAHYGYSREEFLEMTIADIRAPEAIPALLDRLSRSDATYEKRGGWRHRKKNGSIIDVEITAHTMDLDDRLTCIVLANDITDRLRAERELQQKTNLLKAITDGTPDAVFVKDLAGRYLLFNPAASQFVGIPAEQVIGKDDTEIFDPVGARLVMERDRQVLETGRIQTQEEKLTAAGVTRTYLATKAPCRDGQGKMIGVIGISRDITDRHRSEGLIAFQKSVLEVIISGVPLRQILHELCSGIERLSDELICSVLLLSDDGTHLQHGAGPSLSPAYLAAIDGLMIGPVVGSCGTAAYRRKPVIVANIATDPLWQEFKELALREKLQACWSTPVLARDGKVLATFAIYYRVARSPSPDEQQLVEAGVRLTAVAVERCRAEEELRLRDRAIRAVTQGILITDAEQLDDPIIYASPGFERMSGYAAAEVLGRNCRFLQGENTDQAAVKTLRKAIRDGAACTVELLNYRKDKTPFWNELSISPVRDSAGRLTHFVGVLAEITERKRLEEQLRHSQKMEAFGQLAGGIAHDFNNLLTVIIGYSDILLETLNREDAEYGLVQEIFQAGERAASLTRQLLAFSRRQVLQPIDLDLNAVTREMEKMLRRLVSETISFQTHLEPDLWAVRADPGQIEQVILNLVVNARDAMSNGGRLTIETRNVELDESYVLTRTDLRHGACVLLAVHDTGHGMTQEIQERIFEPFFTTKDIGKGTGLGLATVHGILKQSGGHIEVVSEEGSGTSFKVYLPRVDKTAPHSQLVPPIQSPRPGMETVLVVEDESGVREMIGRVLRGCGCTVLEAHRGDVVEQVLSTHSGPIHLLLTDVVMPGMSGRHVAEWVKSRYPEARVLFISGYTDDAVVKQGVQQDGLNFLQKPFSMVDLAAKIREVLDAPVAP